ncbi:hypothetical protein [Winogradskya humida]|uniref:Uncharacterized protein n=1 Tax=Winogradskya humida TaxID=113566 RepID=A0ABQ4A1E0_9ACTN|nr:hypothetical protein [Actinoplanes humidus]GIE24642.1 hypothetical protein Ahu01nite_077440 [Actinoplanes humidus]
MDDLTSLAQLDPARGREPSEQEWSRSRADLTLIMAKQPQARVRPRRLVAVLAAAVTALLVALLPGGNGTAYASWTPVPRTLPGSAVSPEADLCAAGWDNGTSTPGDVVLAERRGRATLLVMWLSTGPLIECTLLEPGEVAGSQRLTDDADAEPPLPAAGRVAVDTRGATGYGARQYSDVLGRAAPDVTGVDLLLPDGTRVQASVAGGWWAAWWPGPEAGLAGGLSVVVHTATGSHTYDL